MDFLKGLFGSKPSQQSTNTAMPTAAPPQPQSGMVSNAPVHTRPLTPPRQFETSTRRLRFGMTSNVGGRQNNEDTAMAILMSAEVTGNPPPLGLFIVADGMGGHQHGEIASSITARTVAQSILQEVLIPQLEERELNANQKTIPEVLSEAMSMANSAVQTQAPGGGTTATCVMIRGDLSYIAHVGDSRAYLLSEGTLEAITRDHLLVRRLQELGNLTSEEADTHPQRNVLYRAIGQSESLEVDASTRRLQPSSKLLLCSDGLWGVVDDESIRSIMQENNDPQEICDQLIAAANANEGQDNITAVVIQMPD
jgi:serine/threonine protein phosphatase PrpC